VSARSALSTCLFDLDGTLIDSIELIFQSYEHAFSAHGLPAPSRDELLSGLGTPLSTQFALRRPDQPDDSREPGKTGAIRIAALIATYREFNLAHHDEMVKPYPGALEAVTTLKRKGLRLGIVTSKRTDTARRGLAVCGFDGLFDDVVGMEDSTKHKPDPEPVLIALRRLRADAATTGFVGDSPHDLVAGLAAGVQVFSAGWGPFPRAAFRGIAMDGWLHEPAEIGHLVPAGVRVERLA
jgi:pyrophosphatase PpaX